MRRFTWVLLACATACAGGAGAGADASDADAEVAADGGSDAAGADAEVAADGGSDAVDVSIPQGCSNDGYCDDGDPCTVDKCLPDHTCDHTGVTAACAIPAMQYAKAPAWTQTAPLCGQAQPYWWASATQPAPLVCATTADCPALAHTDTVVCAGGQCLAAACSAGWQDRNAWGNDGCEVSVPVVCDLYVEVKANPAGADGSAAKPFADPQLAVKAAQAGCVIHLGKGIFVLSAPLVLDKAGLVLRGAGPDQSMLSLAAGYVGLQVEADDVVIEGLAIAQAIRGISVVPTYPGNRILIRNVAISGMVQEIGVIEPSSCMLIDLDGLNEGGNDVRITASWLHDALGGSAMFGRLDSSAILGGTNVRVLGTKIQNIIGLDGTCIAGLDEGAPGGVAVGIGVWEGFASGCEISQLVPGKGGIPGCWQDEKPGTPWPDGFAFAFDQAITTDETDSYDGLPWTPTPTCP